MIKSVVDLFFGGDNQSSNQPIGQRGQNHPQEPFEYLQPQGYIVPVIAWHGQQQQSSNNVRSFESQILSSNLDIQSGEITTLTTAGQLHSVNKVQKQQESQIPSKFNVNGSTSSNKIIQSSGLLATDVMKNNQILLNEIDVDRRTRSLPNNAIPINQLQNLQNISTESTRQPRINGFNASVLQIVTSNNNEQLYVQCSEHTEYYITNICCSSNCLLPLCPECLCKHIHSDNSIPQIENILAVKQAMVMNQEKILGQLTEQRSTLHQTVKTNLDRAIKANRTSLEAAYHELIRNIDVHFVKARENMETNYSQAKRCFKEIDELYENELEDRRILVEQLNQPLYLEQLINALAEAKNSEEIIQELYSSQQIQIIQEFTSSEYVPRTAQDISQAVEALLAELLVQRQGQGNIREIGSNESRKQVQNKDGNSLQKVSASTSQAKQSKTLPDVAESSPIFHHKASSSSIAIPAKSLKTIQSIGDKTNNIASQYQKYQSNLPLNAYGFLNQNHRSFTGRSASKINAYELVGGNSSNSNNSSYTPMRINNNYMQKVVQELNFSAESEEIAEEFEQRQFHIVQKQELMKKQMQQGKQQQQIQGKQKKQQEEYGQDKQFLDVLGKTAQQNSQKLSNVLQNSKSEKGGVQNSKDQRLSSNQAIKSAQIQRQQQQQLQQQQQQQMLADERRQLELKYLESQQQAANKLEKERQAQRLANVNLQNNSKYGQPAQLVSFIEGQRTVQVIHLDKYWARTKEPSPLQMNGQPPVEDQQFIETFCLDIPFCIPLNHAAIAIPNSPTVILTGGVLYEKDKISAISSVYKLSEDNLTLIALPSMLHPRSSHTLVYASNRIYAIGGSSTLDQEIPLKSCEYFDLTQNLWFSMKDCLFSASGSGCCVFEGNWIYKFGGKSSSLREVLHAERYNIQKDYWEEISIGTTLPLNEYPICIQINQNQIMICGGLRCCVRSEAAFVLTIQKDKTIIAQEIPPLIWHIDYQYAQAFISKSNQLLILKDATKAAEEYQSPLFVRFERNKWDSI